MPRVKFKQRQDTLFFSVINRDNMNKGFKEMFCLARHDGEFDVDFHFLVRRNGKVEKGREINEIGGRSLPSNDVSIFIIVDVGESHKQTDAQKIALHTLLKKLKLQYPQARGTLTYDIY